MALLPGRAALLLLGSLIVPLSSLAPLVVDAAAPADWDAPAVAAAAERLMNARTSSLVVTVGGETLVERHATPEARRLSAYARMLHGTNIDGEAIEDVASIQKSVVAVLILQAVERGLLTLDDRITSHLGEDWSRPRSPHEDEIRVRHLLHMNSGIGDDAVPPGTEFRYDTRTYARLVEVLEGASSRSLDAVTAEWLTGPLRMTDSTWRRRTWAGMVGASPVAFVTTADDLVRFGRMILDEGRARDRALLAPERVALLLAPSPTNPAYGMLWWLNATPGDDIDPRIDPRRPFPEAPRELVVARGALARHLHLVPDLDLVLVRLGDDPGRSDVMDRFWRDLTAAHRSAAPAAE